MVATRTADGAVVAMRGGACGQGAGQYTSQVALVCDEQGSGVPTVTRESYADVGPHASSHGPMAP